MKILDIPQSGKRGLNVSQNGAFGQISRAAGRVANPRTPSQMAVRDTMSPRGRPLAGAHGGPTGRLDGGGQERHEQPPPQPERHPERLPAVHQDQLHPGPVRPGAGGRPAGPTAVPDLAPQNLVITNTAGAIALKLTCPTSPGENTIIRGAEPRSQGRETCSDYRILGTCPAPAQGSANITSLYTARYGEPPVGKKVYVQVNQFVDGWESLPRTFWGIVPAAA